MISDRIPPCVVASMVDSFRLVPMCHNSDSEAADRSACFYRETKNCWGGKRSFSCLDIYILEMHNLFSGTRNRDISVKMYSSDDGYEYSNTSCVWLEREYENVYTVSRLTLYTVRIYFLTWEILWSDRRSIA